MTQPAVESKDCRVTMSRPAPVRHDLVAPSTMTAELTLTGEIDMANCDRVPIDVERLCRQGYRRIRIDLEAVAFIDAAAVSRFLEARERAAALRCEVVLCAVHGLPLRVLRMLELDTVLVEEGERHG
jgi:anti-anti-sigma factor